MLPGIAKMHRPIIDAGYHSKERQRRQFGGGVELKARRALSREADLPDVGEVSNTKRRRGLARRGPPARTPPRRNHLHHVQRSKLVHPGAPCTQPRCRRVFSGVNELAADISRRPCHTSRASPRGDQRRADGRGQIRDSPIDSNFSSVGKSSLGASGLVLLIPVEFGAIGEDLIVRRREDNGWREPNSLGCL